jgi:hypothetical protein
MHNERRSGRTAAFNSRSPTTIICCYNEGYFELNPPKIVKDRHFDLVLLNQEIQKFTKRASEFVDLVDGIHLTDSVLGIPRISSVTTANFIKRDRNALNLSCSVRARDAILIGVKGVSAAPTLY